MSELKEAVDEVLCESIEYSDFFDSGDYYKVELDGMLPRGKVGELHDKGIAISGVENSSFGTYVWFRFTKIDEREVERVITETETTIQFE